MPRPHPLPPTVLLFGLLLAGAARAQIQPPEGWDCRYCPEPAVARSALLTVGLGHTTGPLRFSSDPVASALDPGGLAWLDGQWQHRAADGRLLRVDATGLGLDKPWLALRDVQPGVYRLSASWQELVHQSDAGGRTAFHLADGDRLQLPENWISAGSTTRMTSLPDALRPQQPEQERRRLDLGADFRTGAAWRSHVRYHREDRMGSRWLGGAFLSQAAWLPQSLDLSTDRLDLGVDYRAKSWLASLGYGLSLFRNARRSLQWDNAYQPLSPGADAGELALAPDNQAHQLSLAGQYSGHPRLRLDGHLAVGRLLQDEALLAPSLNPNLAPQTPRDSAQARVDTLAAQLRASYQFSRPLRLELRYRHQDRDTRTPAQDFVQVRTDSFIADGRRNLPYAFRDDLLAMQADYRPRAPWKLRLGLEREQRKRDFQARRHSEETRAWGEWRLRGTDPVQLSARLGYARRDGSAFEQAQDPAGQNSQQRAFNLADRQRRDARLRLDILGDAGLQLGLQADWADEDYSDSPLGLQAARRASLGAQLSGGSDSSLLWLLHASHAQARLQQAGGPPLAGWWAASRDLHDSYGLSLDKPGLLPRLDVELDYSYSRSQGRIALRSDAFPELRTRLHSLDLQAVWHWRPRIDWQLRYRYERYQDADWQFDSLAPDSLANVLGPGAPGYNEVLHLFGLGLSYRF